MFDSVAGNAGWQILAASVAGLAIVFEVWRQIRDRSRDAEWAATMEAWEETLRKWRHRSAALCKTAREIESYSAGIRGPLTTSELRNHAVKQSALIGAKAKELSRQARRMQISVTDTLAGIHGADLPELATDAEEDE